jgi:hypothetical protein
MGLAASGVPFMRGGVTAALDYLACSGGTQSAQSTQR